MPDITDQPVETSQANRKRGTGSSDARGFKPFYARLSALMTAHGYKAALGVLAAATALKLGRKPSAPDRSPTLDR